VNLYFDAPGFWPEDEGGEVFHTPPGILDNIRGPARSTDGLTLDSLLRLGREKLIGLLWATDHNIHNLLAESLNLHDARNNFFDYLNDLERSYFNIYSTSSYKDIHDLEKRQAKWCIRVLKNIIRTENELLAEASALTILWQLAHRRPRQLATTHESFLCEMLFLFLGINGRFAFYRHEYVPKAEADGEQNAGLRRSRFLDEYARHIQHFVTRYRDGIEEEAIVRAGRQAEKIMKHFGAGQDQWRDYRWQLKNVLGRLADIERLVELSQAEREGLALAEKHGIPVQITPYYLSLFHPQAGTGLDAAVRAQVLPGCHYVKGMAEALEAGRSLDFMGEASTSPVEGITRRYVQVLILKAFDGCPQICVYCQRNWELKELSECSLNREKLERAIDWIADNEHIEEVLFTGGDPLTLPDDFLKWMLDRVAAIGHVQRIRIGTRTPVTLPFRITEELVKLLAGYHEFGRREVCVVTHFETGLEMTPEALSAIRRLRAAGFNVYNQQVFTYYNSRKFESFHLRKLLKRCGVDPYYCFNTKGKEETRDYQVPITRLLQEWAEEARLAPGLCRTDTPVFNVPTLGKSYLQSWQDHEIIMILPDGSRVYRFYPWESMLSLASPYIFTDTQIYDYLRRLQADGEDVNDYYTIWYYF